MLDRPVGFERDGSRRPFTSDQAGLVVALVLAGPAGVSTTDLRRMLDVDAEALRKRRQRLSTLAGLTIVTASSNRETVYRLDAADLEVDAWEYLELAAGLNGGRPGPTVLDRATTLWAAGPPELGASAPAVVRAALDRLHAAHDVLSRLGRRILVVDDRIGDRLAELLRMRHSCDVARSVSEFNELKTGLDRYDLVVVDLHLSPDYGDKQGDAIVRYINEKAFDVPVAMMSVTQPVIDDFVRWTDQLGLAAFIQKQGDGPAAELGSVEQRINQLLDEDPAERACEHIARRLVTLRRKARKRLERQLSGHALDRELRAMNAEANHVSAAAEQADLAGTRQRLAGFVRRWGD